MNNQWEVIEATRQAEDVLLGAILIDSSDGTNEAMNAVHQSVTPLDFYQEIDRDIFTAMLSCQEAPHQINVAREMARLGICKNDCVSHMSLCISQVPCSLDYEDYAKTVKEYADRRRGGSSHRAKGFTE